MTIVIYLSYVPFNFKGQPTVKFQFNICLVTQNLKIKSNLWLILVVNETRECLGYVARVDDVIQPSCGRSRHE